MKKITSILALLLVVGGNFSFAANIESDCNKGIYGGWNPTTSSCCAKWQTYDATVKVCILPETVIEGDKICNTVKWITICEDCLTNGQCKFNIYDTLDIRKNVRTTEDPTSVGLFVQDIVLSATFFIWTVVTIALIVSGLMYILAAASGNTSLADKAQKGIIGAIIWLILVTSSYFIIRLVQYLAKGV